MKKIFLLMGMLICTPAFSQSVTAPCVTNNNGYPSGTKSCTVVTATNPLPTTGTPSPVSGSGDYVSKTITNTSAQVLAANPTRKFLDIVNASATDTIACNLGGTAIVNGAGSYTIPPMWHRSWEDNYIPLDAINCIGSTASVPATVGEK